MRDLMHTGRAAPRVEKSTAIRGVVSAMAGGRCDDGDRFEGMVHDYDLSYASTCGQ